MRTFSKLLMSQPGQQLNTIHKLSNIIEYNMRNILLEKLYSKCSGEASSRSFYEKSKLSTSLN